MVSSFSQNNATANILYNQLQKTKTDSVEIQRAIQVFEECIQKERSNIDNIEIVEDSVPKQRRPNEDYLATRRAAAKVCDIIITQVGDRFKFTNHLIASKLFTSENFLHFTKNFPLAYLESTIESYPFLNKASLQTELKIIYDRPDFRSMSGALVFLKFIIENSLQDVFTQTYILLQILVTMPMTTAEAERCFSTLKRIKTFLRSTMKEERLSALAMLTTEKKLVEEIQDFNELVINKFASIKKRRVDFTYKQCT